MLKQLILENWKSFRYAELPLDPLTVIIGTNASGKSNVVEALEVLQIAFTREDIKPALIIDKSTTLVLPLAAVIETGNHIAQAKTANSESKRIAAHKFAEIITYAADETTPWAKFREQIVLWEEEGLKELAAEFPNQAVETSIVILGWHYHQKGFHVEFLTDDDKLKSQEPPPPQPPTRRSSRTKR
nr:AAA family ATPase [Nostoc flagelliforme]